VRGRNRALGTGVEEEYPPAWGIWHNPSHRQDQNVPSCTEEETCHNAPLYCTLKCWKSPGSGLTGTWHPSC
jgi:hypothetical protein